MHTYKEVKELFLGEIRFQLGISCILCEFKACGILCKDRSEQCYIDYKYTWLGHQSLC